MILVGNKARRRKDIEIGTYKKCPDCKDSEIVKKSIGAYIFIQCANCSRILGVHI